MTHTAYYRHASRRSHRSTIQQAMITQKIPEYIPVSEKARAFHASTAKINLLVGANQSSKTTTASHDHVMYARKCPPGCQGLALTNTYKNIGENLWPHYKECLADGEYTVVWQNRSLEIPNMVRLTKNGYKIYFGSYDQGRMARQGVKWDYLHPDEECPYDIWIETYRGCIARGARIGYSYTPIEGYEYLEELEAKGKDPNEPNYWTPKEPMTLMENPYISQEEKDLWISMLPPSSRKLRVEGLRTDPEGLVYSYGTCEFDEGKHIIEPFPIPNNWKFYRGIDYGKEHPTTSIIIATDGYTYYIISEYYQAQRLVEYHIVQMYHQYQSLLLKKSSPQPRLFTVSDHDAQLRLEYENPKFKASPYGDIRIFTTPAQKDIVAGIETVQSLIAQDRLYIFNTCTMTQKERRKYKYHGADKKGLLKPGEKADHPIDAWNDCWDPIRYILVQAVGYLQQQIYEIISVRKG